MTKITIEITDKEDKQIRHLMVDNDIVVKSKYIEKVLREHLAIMKDSTKELKWDIS